jgi:hypothetical protein
MTHDDTAAATLAARTFRTLMAIAAVFDLDIRQIDAVNAFVNSELDEEVYTWMAEGFSEYGYHSDLTNRKPWTPVTTESLRSYDGKATIDEIHHYQSKIRSILYAAVITRLDIAKIMSDLARHLLIPGPAHFDAANRVIVSRFDEGLRFGIWRWSDREYLHHCK